MKKWMRFMMLAVLPAAMLVSCDEDGDDVIAQKDEARIMVVHASPDAPGIDLLVDDAKVNSNTLTYPDNIGYLTLEAGNRNLKVNPAGTNTSVIDINQNFTKDQSYSVFAVGTTDQNDAADLRLLVFTDDLTAPTTGNARVRFIHLSPDAPAVDIVNVTDPEAESVLFDAQAYENASAFSDVPAGIYNLDVRTDSDGTVLPATDLTDIQLESGKIYTIFVRGYNNAANMPEGNTNNLGVEVIEHEAR